MRFCAEKSNKKYLKPLLLDPQLQVTSGRTKLIGQHHPDKITIKVDQFLRDNTSIMENFECNPASTGTSSYTTFSKTGDRNGRTVS